MYCVMEEEMELIEGWYPGVYQMTYKNAFSKCTTKVSEVSLSPSVMAMMLPPALRAIILNKGILMVREA